MSLVIVASIAAAQTSISFKLNHTTEVPHASNIYSITTETYYSDPISLGPGHMIFTSPSSTPLTLPSGRIGITSFFGDIVDADHQPVPLSKVYDHHWIAVASTHTNEICSSSLNYVFGIGAESRHGAVDLPDGHAYVVDNDHTNWGANIHLLRTEGLAGDNEAKAAKECNECYYAPNKGTQCTPSQNGTFLCCGEGDWYGVESCPTASGALPPVATFHLRYRVSYTRSVSAVTPVHISIASAPDCATFYDVLRNDAQPEHLVQYSFKVPVDVTVVFAAGHQHTGALNISLNVNGVRQCTSYPRYGTQKDVAGNELGYLVQMSNCVNASTGPLKLKRGDEVRIDSYYYAASHDPRLQYSDGTHLNVMGYMYLAYTRAGGNAPSGALETSQTPLLRAPGVVEVDSLESLDSMALDGMASAPIEQSDVRGTRVWRRVPPPAQVVEAA